MNIVKKIILVGCGEMGSAHLKSLLFFNKNYKIIVVEKNKSRLKKIKKNFRNRNLLFLNKLPSNDYFKFAIIATHSINRLKIIKELLRNNLIDFLFLEKFIFPRKREYKIATRIFKKKRVKVFVNIWAKIFINICNLKKIKNIKYLTVKIRKGRILTNLVHYLSLVEILVGKNTNLFFLDNKFRNTKFKKNIFTEYFGKVSLTYKDKIIGIIQNSKDKFDYLYFKTNNEDFKIIIMGKKIVLQKKYKKDKILNFPLNSLTTSKILKNISSPHKKIVPSFNEASRLSVKILDKIKRVNIRIR
tara:strand:+ start:3118 stop:4020 length:903 start_codon:yes stop_codon:yes gene_type:complete